MDFTGQVTIAPQFDYADRFVEGLAQVKINNKWGFINPAGSIVIKPQFDETDRFSEGLALVGIKDRCFSRFYTTLINHGKKLEFKRIYVTPVEF